MDKEDKKYLKQVGESIATIRKQKNLTQEEVCTELEMDKPYLSSIENGRQNVTCLTLKKIAKVIGVEVSEFFDFSPK